MAKSIEDINFIVNTFFCTDHDADSDIQSKIILESPVKSADQFYISVVKPSLAMMFN